MLRPLSKNLRCSADMQVWLYLFALVGHAKHGWPPADTEHGSRRKDDIKPRGEGKLHLWMRCWERAGSKAYSPNLMVQPSAHSKLSTRVQYMTPRTSMPSRTARSICRAPNHEEPGPVC